MVTARQAKEMVNNAIEKEMMEKRVKALEFCENLGNEIANRANEKLSNITVSVDSGIRAYVIKELQDNEYKVEVNDNNNITVMW